MSDPTPIIETMEHRWMRAWVNRDAKTLKSLTARDFILLFSSKPPAILDRPSWLVAATERYHCSSYRFTDIYVRDWGAVAVFTGLLELEATMDDHDWSDRLWVNDVWRRGRVRRGWKLAQRTLSRPTEDTKLRVAIKSLQLWK